MSATDPKMSSETTESNPVVNKPVPHDSAHKHVTGSAPYVDDLPQSEQLLHAYVGFSTEAHAQIESLDLSDVLACPGVQAVIEHAIY